MDIRGTDSGISQRDYETFRDYLEDACGIVLGDNKHYLVSSRLGRLMQEHSIRSVGELVANLKDNPGSVFHERIIDAMTTNETSWFRDNHPYEALTQHVFPELGGKRIRDIRVWSAACSSGQEPYSISITVQEFFRLRPGMITNVQIVGTDISPSMLKIAREGVFDENSLRRGMSDDRRKLHFRQTGEKWKLKNEIQSRVIFREINLLKDFSTIGKFDCIFCRNVLIYFSPEIKRDIIHRLTAALKPEGYLILGGSESIANYSSDFKNVRFQNGLLYKKNPNIC